MKTVYWTLLGVALVGVTVLAANARQPYATQWKANYVDENKDPAFAAAVKEAGCNVCHKGAKKTDHNEYGLALKKSWNLQGFNAVKANPAALEKYIAEGLEKAAAEKAKSGQTYGELIKSGKLPGG